MGSPAARVSTQAGGSQTGTGTDVTRSSAVLPPAPAGQRTARVARRVPDSRTRISAGAEQGPHSTARVTDGDSAAGFVVGGFLVDGIAFLLEIGPDRTEQLRGSRWRKSRGTLGRNLRRGCDTHPRAARRSAT